MKNLIAAVFSASILTAFAPITLTTNAFAYTAEDAAICGTLPNMKWTWSIVVTPPEVIEGPITYGTVSYSGNSGNGSAPASQEVTTIPGSTVCTALNPAGKVNDDHSTVIGGGEPYTETVDLGSVQVCFNGPNTPDLIAGCR